MCSFSAASMVAGLITASGGSPAGGPFLQSLRVPLWLAEALEGLNRQSVFGSGVLSEVGRGPSPTPTPSPG